MDTIRVTLTGVAPMMTHNIRLANPLDPITKDIKAITGKRKKTEDDLQQIGWLEWLGGLYYDEKIGPYNPGVNIDGMLFSAAKMQKRGTDARRGLMTVDDKMPIEYDGPRDPKAMFKAGKWVDVRAVRNQANRVMRTRPIFPEWAVSFDLAYDPEIFNRADVIQILENAGRFIGLNDGRPRYGRFSAKFA